MTCTVTVTNKKVGCDLPQGHGGQHKGGGWVWWHGNGEECPADCHTCEHLEEPPSLNQRMAAIRAETSR